MENVDLDGRIVVETQNGVYVIEITPEGSAEIGVVVTPQTTIESWEDLATVYGDELSQVLQKSFLTERAIKSIFGSGLTATAIEDGDVEILKWGLQTDGNNQLNAVEFVGIRHNYNGVEERLRSFKFTFNPIPFSSLIGENGEIDWNRLSFSGTQNLTGTDYKYNVSLTDEEQQVFNSCINLLYLDDYLTNNSYECEYITYRGSTDSTFGSSYYVTLKFVDTSEDVLYTFGFMVDSDGQSALSSILSAEQEAVINQKKLYKIDMALSENILSSDIIIFVNEELQVAK